MTIYTPWREQLGEGLAPLQEKLRPPYEEVRHVRGYSSWLVPGMLQTRRYIDTVFASIQTERGLSDEDVALATESRLARQPLLHAEDRLYEFLIEEGSLRTGIGGTDVMREQLTHLLDMVGGDAPVIGILPMRMDRLRWPEASFWLYDSDTVNIELVSGSVDLTGQADFDEYEGRFAQLAAEALYGDAAFRLLYGIVEEMGV
jgi:hypothetical protein